MKKWIVSTENNPWYESKASSSAEGEKLTIGEAIGKPLYGFGCCISELSAKAIKTLPVEKQNAIFDLLFGKENCNFNFCRLPIGANDFAEIWYSYNEHEGDYEMTHFSIDRDKKYIIPAVKEAQKLAASKGLDLVKIAPQAVPPVCKILDYGKYCFEQTKRENAQLKELLKECREEIGDEIDDCTDPKIELFAKITEVLK